MIYITNDVLGDLGSVQVFRQHILCRIGGPGENADTAELGGGA